MGKVQRAKALHDAEAEVEVEAPWSRAKQAKDIAALREKLISAMVIARLQGNTRLDAQHITTSAEGAGEPCACAVEGRYWAEYDRAQIYCSDCLKAMCNTGRWDTPCNRAESILRERKERMANGNK